MTSQSTEAQAVLSTPDIRRLKFKSINKMLVVGMGTLLSILALPIYVYVCIEQQGFERYFSIVVFPICVVIASVVISSIIAVMVFLGLNINRFIFRRKSGASNSKGSSL